MVLMKNISPVIKNTIFIGLFLVPFVPFLVSSTFFFPYITTKVFAWRAIVEVVFAAWLVLALWDPAYRPKRSIVFYSVFAFLAVIGLADLFGADRVSSFWSNFERMEGYISLLHLGAFFLVIGSVFSEDNWKTWWNTSLAASAIMAFYALLQVLGAISPSQDMSRVDGTFGNAIYLAVYMLIHIFVALLLMTRNWRDRGLRWTYGILILFQIIVIYYTATRGAIIGLLGGLFIMAFLNLWNKEEKSIKRASLVIIIALAVLVGSFFAVKNTEFVKRSPILSRFSSLTFEEIKTQGRYFVWPIALQGFKEKPILGWGQENFSYVFQEHYKPEMYYLEPWFDRAHNIFLDWAVVGGLLGLLAYLALYAVFLRVVWRNGNKFSFAEKSIFTGLLSAYFFHNFFVFDHLTSYVLFFSLLAYIHSHGAGEGLWQKSFSEARIKNLAMPAAAVALVFALYFVNLKPLLANAYLIEALRSVQLNKYDAAIENFKKAYSSSILGKTEATEQMSSNADAIISSSLPNEAKSAYLGYVKDAVVKNTELFPENARVQILAGSFLFRAGLPDEALAYLLKAEELSPGKQMIKFEIAETYLYKGEMAKALDAARRAYELDPTYAEAQFTYAVMAIYAGNRELENFLKNRIYDGDITLENKLKKSGGTVDLESWVSSDLITSAYIKVGRYADAVSLLKKRLERNPDEMQNYISLASAYLEMGDKEAAIKTLIELGQALPEYKNKVDEYIRQVRSQ